MSGDERKSWAEVVWETAMKAIDPGKAEGRKWLGVMEARLAEARERRLAKAAKSNQAESKEG